MILKLARGFNSERKNRKINVFKKLLSMSVLESHVYMEI